MVWRSSGVCRRVPVGFAVARWMGRPSSLAVLPATRAVPWLEELGVRPRLICFTGSFLLRLVSKISSDGVPSASGAPVVFL